MFSVCEIGQSVDNQFDRLSDMVYECDWYLLSLTLQRMLITVIANAQEPVSIRSFGNIKCSRESFMRV